MNINNEILQLKKKIKELEEITISLKQENLCLQKSGKINKHLEKIEEEPELENSFKKVFQKVYNDVYDNKDYENDSEEYENNYDPYEQYDEPYNDPESDSEHDLNNYIGKQYFVDLLWYFYEEIYVLLKLARNSKKNGEDVYDILEDIIQVYMRNYELLSRFICSERLENMEIVIDMCKNNIDMDDIDKIEYFYNKIYHEIFSEFLPYTKKVENN